MIARMVAIYCVGLAIGGAAPARAAADDHSVGIWSNPQNGVHVQSHHYGTSMCGTVVWANDKANARRGGTETLVGLQLFRDIRQDRLVTDGRVFVPDVNKTFSGSIRVIDADTVKGRGCLVPRVGCKSQTWVRIK